MTRIAVFVLVLVVGCTTTRVAVESKSPNSMESDRAVLGVLKSQIPEVEHLARVHRIQATPELDLVVAFSRYDTGDGTPNGYIAFGAFLQRRDRPSLVYKLSARWFQEDPTIIVERATPTDLVLSVSGDRQEAFPTEKLVFDPRAKALVRHFQYVPWEIGRAFPHESGAVFLATDHARVVAFNFEPTRERSFEMLSPEETMRWSKDRIVDDWAGIEKRKWLNFANDEFQPVAFGKNGSFRLAKDSFDGTLAVEETWGSETMHYSIPQTDPETTEEKIGGWDVEDGALWVGKDFFAGSTGIGGFGWFDQDARTFRLSSPPEMRDFSITAMQVDKDAIWMALTYHGESGDYDSSLARYDRATKTIRTLPLREPGKQFLRIGDSLLLVTPSSVVLVSNDGVRSFFVDETSDGRLRVAEAVGAEAVGAERRLGERPPGWHALP